MVLASGHVSPEEDRALQPRRRAGRLPHGRDTPGWDSNRRADTGDGVPRRLYRVHLPGLHAVPDDHDRQGLAAAIRETGPDHCVLTTDFGHPENPPPVEGMRMAIVSLLQAGLTSEEVTKVVKQPAAAAQPGRVIARRSEAFHLSCVGRQAPVKISVMEGYSRWARPTTTPGIHS